MSDMDLAIPSQSGENGIRKKISRWYDYELECAHCHKRFDASRPDARFCSGECRVRHWREERRKPEYLLKDKPDMLARYNVLKEVSPDSAKICAQALRNLSVSWGCDLIMACVWSAIGANYQMLKVFQAACNEIDEEC